MVTVRDRYGRFLRTVPQQECEHAFGSVHRVHDTWTGEWSLMGTILGSAAYNRALKQVARVEAKFRARATA